MTKDFSIKYDLNQYGIDVREFYGISDLNIAHLRGKLPHMQIVARGSVIVISGREQDVESFDAKFEKLVDYFLRFRHISTHVIDQVFDTIDLTSERDVAIESSKGGDDTIVVGVHGNIIKAITINQRRMVDSYRDNDLLIVIGPAGSGKTYTAIALAVKALSERRVKKVILTRPAVEAGEKLGFLPGDMKNKLDPYLQPLYDALHDMIPQKRLSAYMEEGVIQIAPLAYMRGRTLDNAFVILDEAQNTTMAQMKMFLTRMGKNAKFIVTGDASQIDLPKKSDSGLMRSVNMLKDIKGISVIETTGEDIIRHALVRDIVKAFEEDKKIV